MSLLPEPETAAPFDLELDASDAAAYAALADDRIWNGYSIADLVPPLRQHTTVAVAARGGRPVAAVLVLRHPAFSAVMPHGVPAGVAALLDALTLPAATFLLVRPEHLPAVEGRYHFPAPRRILRMAVDGATFRPPALLPREVEPLGEADLPHLLDLYTAYPESAFTADQLHGGPFYGVRAAGENRLLAAGGVHVVAPAYGLAAVGNIYTRPEARGRGYGLAITAAVVAHLLGLGCRDIILNIAVDNPARRLYERLGFRSHCGYVEGTATLLPGSQARAE